MLGGGDVNGVTLNIEIIKLDYTEPRRGARSVPYCFFKFFRKLFTGLIECPKSPILAFILLSFDSKNILAALRSLWQILKTVCKYSIPFILD